MVIDIWWFACPRELIILRPRYPGPSPMKPWVLKPTNALVTFLMCTGSPFWHEYTSYVVDIDLNGNFPPSFLSWCLECQGFAFARLWRSLWCHDPCLTPSGSAFLAKAFQACVCRLQDRRCEARSESNLWAIFQNECSLERLQGNPTQTSQTSWTL